MTRSARCCALLLTLGLLGCPVQGVKGNGEIKTESREMGTFSAIRAGGAYRLLVDVGGSASLGLRGDSNLLPLIETSVKGETLEIRCTKNLRPTDGITVTVQLPRLVRLAVSGAVSGRVGNVTGERLDVELSGAGALALAGSVAELGLSLSGAGKVRAEELQAEQVRVSSSGAGSVEVRASKTLDVKLSGVGSVTYHGDPKVTKQISGLGSVVKK